MSVDEREFHRVCTLFRDYVSGGFAGTRDFAGSESGHDAPETEVEPEAGANRAAPQSGKAAAQSAVDSESEGHSRQARRRELDELADRIRECTKCPLSAVRTNAVPGEGALDALVMVIGEGPGADEDRSGRPFVGRAGQYLDKWLAAIDVSRDRNAFIANIVKCRPPQNRDPLPDERASCFPYLERQIELVRPRSILTVGRVSSRVVTGVDASMAELRKGEHVFRGIPVFATYHPSAVLRNYSLRRPVWEDLKRVRAAISGEA